MFDGVHRLQSMAASVLVLAACVQPGLVPSAMAPPLAPRGTVALGQPAGPPLIAPAVARAADRREIVAGTPASVEMALRPCFPDRAVPFDGGIDLRPRLRPGEFAVVWSGQFRVDAAGGGNWALIVEDDAGRLQASFAVGTGIAAGTLLDAPILVTSRVRFRLQRSEGGGACPSVVLQQELRPLAAARPRGVHGSDDRWVETASELGKIDTDGSIRTWAKSTVRLVTTDDAGQELPCSGFFLAPHVLMTASHCLQSNAESGRAVVFLPGREARGQDLSLLAVQGDLDFTLLKVKGPNPAALDLGREPFTKSPALVLWQHPPDRGKVVSVRDCNLQGTTPPEWVHLCDSSLGTSGSPIQLRQGGRVFGLHVRGCAGIVNGTPGCHNFGTRIIEIRARLAALDGPLRAKDPEAADEIAAALAR